MCKNAKVMRVLTSSCIRPIVAHQFLAQFTPTADSCALIFARDEVQKSVSTSDLSGIQVARSHLDCTQIAFFGQHCYYQFEQRCNYFQTKGNFSPFHRYPQRKLKKERKTEFKLQFSTALFALYVTLFLPFMFAWQRRSSGTWLGGRCFVLGLFASARSWRKKNAAEYDLGTDPALWFWLYFTPQTTVVACGDRTNAFVAEVNLLGNYFPGGLGKNWNQLDKTLNFEKYWLKCCHL